MDTMVNRVTGTMQTTYDKECSERRRSTRECGELLVGNTANVLRKNCISDKRDSLAGKPRVRWELLERMDAVDEQS